MSPRSKSTKLSPSDPVHPLSQSDEDWQDDWEHALETAPGTGRAHPHVHDPTSQRKLLNRLARIEGHIHGIRSMIENHQPCPDVLLQIAAVRGALDRVARLILDDHISQCITHATETGDIEMELEELKKALDRFIR